MLASCIDYAAARDAGGSLGAQLGIGILALGIPLMVLNKRLAGAAAG